MLRAVPFSSWEEWLTVKNGLYSLEREARQHAVEIVRTWRFRGNIPNSADHCAHIINVQLQDESLKGNSDAGDVIRLQYAAVVLRSVNGIVEPSQQGFYAQPVAVLAGKLGLPGWIVELRHDSTHKHLPSLTVLRSAAGYLTTWYRNNYWEPQLQLIHDLSAACLHYSEPPVDTTARDAGNISMLQKYCRSSTFITDVFLPLFVSSILSQSQSQDLHEDSAVHEPAPEEVSSSNVDNNGVQLNKVDESFRGLFGERDRWRPLVSFLSREAKEAFHHSCLCRLGLAAVDLLRGSTKGDRRQKLEIISWWVQEVYKLFELHVGNKDQDYLASRQRKTFLKTVVNRLQSANVAEDEGCSTISVYKMLEVFEAYLSNCKADEPSKATSRSSADRPNRIDTIDVSTSRPNRRSHVEPASDIDEAEMWMNTLKSSNEAPNKVVGKKRSISSAEESLSSQKRPTITLSIADSGRSYFGSKEPSNVKVADSFEVWPIGLLPGQYDNSDLFALGEIKSDPSNLNPSNEVL